MDEKVLVSLQGRECACHEVDEKVFFHCKVENKLGVAVSRILIVLVDYFHLDNTI